MQQITSQNVTTNRNPKYTNSKALVPGVNAGMLPENNDEEVTVVAFSRPPRTESPARQQTNLTTATITKFWRWRCEIWL